MRPTFDRFGDDVAASLQALIRLQTNEPPRQVSAGSFATNTRSHSNTRSIVRVSILDKIIARTRQTIEQDKSVVPPRELSASLNDLPPTLGFADALAATDEVRLIAEVKKQSPSAGLIRDDFDPPSIAAAYQDGGAACISVLTDEPFFGGRLEFLAAVRRAVDVPILRKDFIVDAYQIDQARLAGADAVLLIAECLTPSQLIDLHHHAAGLSMDTLIELYDPENLDHVLATATRLVGVNNRNLHTFETSLEHTIEIGRSVPKDRLLVGESGIHTNDDVRHLAAGGVKAILVGESLMRQSDIVAATRRLLGTAG